MKPLYKNVWVNYWGHEKARNRLWENIYETYVCQNTCTQNIKQHFQPNNKLTQFGMNGTQDFNRHFPEEETRTATNHRQHAQCERMCFYPTVGSHYTPAGTAVILKGRREQGLARKQRAGWPGLCWWDWATAQGLWKAASCFLVKLSVTCYTQSAALLGTIFCCV